MFKKESKSKNDNISIPSREIKESKLKENLTKPVNHKEPSILSKDIKINGEISGSSDVDIYGGFEGNINLDNNNVNIETSANIKANIKAKTIRVNGKITGNLTAIDKILVTSKGSIVGDLNSGKIELQDGANFDGNISMKKQNSPKPNK
jgi:cytoskeletal protein CcmA (bactofilin family)